MEVSHSSNDMSGEPNEDLILDLSREPFGDDLARRLWRAFRHVFQGEGIYNNHRDYCGIGLVRNESGVGLYEVYDGQCGPSSSSLKSWSTAASFIGYWARQSDYGLCGADPMFPELLAASPTLINNQRLTRLDLEGSIPRLKREGDMARVMRRDRRHNRSREPLGEELAARLWRVLSQLEVGEGLHNDRHHGGVGVMKNEEGVGLYLIEAGNLKWRYLLKSWGDAGSFVDYWARQSDYGLCGVDPKYPELMANCAYVLKCKSLTKERIEGFVYHGRERREVRAFGAGIAGLADRVQYFGVDVVASVKNFKWSIRN